LNPIENEAVVAALLKQCDGALELLDVTDELPNLKRSPGLHEWQVWDKFGYHPTFESAAEQSHKLSPTMFSDEETKNMPLERCLRLLPHHQDTGGFFVAVFEKKKEMEVTNTAGAKQAPASKERLKLSINVHGNESVALSYETYTINRNSGVFLPEVDEQGEYLIPNRGAKGPNGGSRWLGIDPVYPVNDPKVIESIYSVYGIQPSDIALHKNCVTRTADTSRPKRMYTITDSLRQYLACDSKEQLRVTCCGLKAFERQEIKDADGGDDNSVCDFRLTQDGLPMMFPFVRHRIIRPTFEDYKKLLERRTLAFEYNAEAPQRAVISDEDTKKAILDLSLGCCILIPRDEDLAAVNVSKLDLAIACWRGRTSCNLLVSKAETVHFIDKLRDVKASSASAMET
jgi:multisite-specific tRNA:(cytosine-C5)-methyltransferase